MTARKPLDALRTIGILRGLQQAASAMNAAAAARRTTTAKACVEERALGLAQIEADFETMMGGGRFDPTLAGGWAAAWRRQSHALQEERHNQQMAEAVEAVARADWDRMLTLEEAARKALRRAQSRASRIQDDTRLADLAEQACLGRALR